MTGGLTFEVCVDSTESALAAQQGGAGRIELCSDLIEGGLTPSCGMLRTVRASVDLKIMVMVRPRGGDFCYSDAEFRVMQQDIAAAKDAGADGVVLGLLLPDGTIDSERTQHLLSLARPLPVTFHRAFDMTRDPYAALERLIELGIDRVLTSGQEPTVWEGVDLIAELVRRARGRIIVMPGGGITARNVGRVVAATAVTEVHFGCATPVEGRMAFRNPRVFMGGTIRPPEYTLEIARAEDVARIIAAARGQAGSY
jgi:copper homeostasis protein